LTSAGGQAFTGARAVAGVFFHTCAIKTDNSIWCWGNNQAGELGDGSETSRRYPVRVSALFTNATDITAENSVSCARTADRQIWCWGSNRNGQLGLEDRNGFRNVPVRVRLDTTSSFEGVEAVELGSARACALRTDRTLWCWGTFGQNAPYYPRAITDINGRPLTNVFRFGMANTDPWYIRTDGSMEVRGSFSYRVTLRCP